MQVRLKMENGQVTVEDLLDPCGTGDGSSDQ